MPPDLGVLVLGGADAWTGGGGPAGEVRAGLGADHGPFRGSASGSLEAIGDATLLLVDQLRGTASWRPTGERSLAPIAELGASGSIAGPWFSGVAKLGVDLRTRAVGATLELGGGVREAGATVGPEGLGALVVGLPIGPLWSSTSGSARILGGDLPPLVLDASQWFAVGDRFRLEVGAVASGVPEADAVAAAGLPAPGAIVVQGVVAGSVTLAERWSLRLEVGPERAWGVVPYSRIRALAGVRADLGPEGPQAPVPTPAGTRFELRAPGADRVEVLGAFSDWRPVPMVRQGGRWTAELDVPPGTWEFVYRVDGETQAPPAADRYVPDGFGGTNGVVVVR